MAKRIAMLATGNELVCGDSLNTTAPRMAERMRAHGIHVGEHRVVGDDEAAIEQALRELGRHFDAVIVTGGLGPTSDDRTRFALAAVVARELVFDDECWGAITSRLASLGIVAHTSNRQQALFPKGSRVLANPQGTAPGCALLHEGKRYFLLPGPPRECLPLFEREVLPELLASGFADPSHTLVFRLLGAVEADMASRLDEIVRQSGIEGVATGTRWHYPYLDLKVTFPGEPDETLVCGIEAALTPWLVTREDRTASELLRDWLAGSQVTIFLRDEATAGLCEATFTTPNTRARFVAVHDDTVWSRIPEGSARARLTGLAEYWAGAKLPTTTKLELVLEWRGRQRSAMLEGALRGAEATKLGVEWTALTLWKWLRDVR